MENKNQIAKIAAVAAGALAAISFTTASAESLFQSADLGSGSELRSELLFGNNGFTTESSSNSIELKCGEKEKEGKCGEKEAEHKCGEKDKEGKCGEGKCGEGKCGEKDADKKEKKK